MALFNDGPMNRVEELAAHDSSLLETSTIEGIDVAAQIENAQDAIASEVLTFLQDNKSVDLVFGDVLSCQRRLIGVGDVVVTAELKRWHAFQTLHAVYFDANGHQSNGRYQWKWQEYGTLARTAKEKCLNVGIGLAADPISRAQTPIITTVAGAGLAATVYFAVSFVNAAGQEGAASDLVKVDIATARQAQVNLGATAKNARGWNVYAGNDPGLLMRQNDDVLGLSDFWIQPGVLKTGAAPGSGQSATFYAVQNRVIRRG
jgi:hypothetical protein